VLSKNVLHFFHECISGLADFQDISGLYSSRLANFKISGLVFSGFKTNISGLAINGKKMAIGLNGLKEQCHEMVVEMRSWSSNLCLN
jgi:hypothetical protein